jgi:flagellar biosynthesis protein FliP
VPRKRYYRSDHIRTSAPREITLVVAVIFWLLGFMDVMLDAISLPYNLGVLFLVVAGLLLILGSIVEGL